MYPESEAPNEDWANIEKNRRLQQIPQGYCAIGSMFNCYLLDFYPNNPMRIDERSEGCNRSGERHESGICRICAACVCTTLKIDVGPVRFPSTIPITGRSLFSFDVVMCYRSCFVDGH